MVLRRNESDRRSYLLLQRPEKDESSLSRVGDQKEPEGNSRGDRRILDNATGFGKRANVSLPMKPVREEVPCRIRLRSGKEYAAKLLCHLE